MSRIIRWRDLREDVIYRVTRGPLFSSFLVKSDEIYVKRKLHGKMVFIHLLNRVSKHWKDGVRSLDDVLNIDRESLEKIEFTEVDY